ncbi:hypothetical protein MMARJ_51310 (plasmid) [Mycobacterium marseillense]|uniref:DUF4145 domain-containing protein n=2 Tax=Mycobacterium marseillense TaxID=701042 RepID=A0ABM7JLU1_9MYCO|nr:hypothetical protein MMARJ_51310 [Mycobacterium marseillense]
MTPSSSVIRTRVLQALAMRVDSRFGESYFVQWQSSQLQCRPQQVMEVLWGLVGEGLVYLDMAGQGSNTSNWWWRLSSVGQTAAQGGSWEPRDVDGYLKRLRAHRPAVDEGAVRYVEEALRAFNARCYLATSVMLGVASERVINDLGHTLADAAGVKATKLSKLLSSPTSRLAAQFDKVRKLLVQMELPEGLTDTLTLDAVADLLRVSRNDAGHPTGAVVDEDTAYTHLQMAARYLQKMTTLHAHLKVIAAESIQGT